MVKISVIVPVYNVEDFLKKCMDSIINQTLDDIEIICVNDGSTDSSLEILNDYQKNDDRIIVISQENQGLSGARNIGMQLVNGKYTLFIDSDDWIESNCLEKLYNHAISNNSDIVLFNFIEQYDNDLLKQRIYLPIDESIDYDKFTFDYKFNKRLVMNSMFVIGSKLYKTSFLKDNDIKFINEIRMFEDVPFHIETMLCAERISYLPEILYNYNKLNLTSSQNKKTFNKWLILFDVFNVVEKILYDYDYNSLESNFIEFELLHSYLNLNQSEDGFKEEFYFKMRKEFINMQLKSEILKKLPKYLYKTYIHTINFNSYYNYHRFIDYTNKKFKFINKKEIDNEIRNFKEIGVDLNETSQSLIVSLTSFPERMYDIHYCLYSLLNQTLKPNKVILWLAKEQFPNKEKDIPQKVLDLKKNGLTIQWYHNINSYKKLIPSLKQYPNDYIVTADDDIFYPGDWLEKIWEAHKKYPNTIISSRSRRIGLDKQGNIKKYLKWSLNTDEMTPSYFNFPTNGAGTLFYPNSLNNEIFNEELFSELCPTGDDIWIWAMLILNKTKIYSIEDPMHILCYVNIARELSILDENTLWEINQLGQNDIQMSNVLKYFPNILEIIKKYYDFIRVLNEF